MFGLSVYKGNVNMELGRTPRRHVTLSPDMALDTAELMKSLADAAEKEERFVYGKVVQFAVRSHDGKVWIVFPEPVSGMVPIPPKAARQVADLLINKATFAQSNLEVLLKGLNE